jgi:beta-phosphoglucomutase-like phosphatase (HAD superfamily)
MIQALNIFTVNFNSKNILFFDLDGTLVDTNLANFLSYKKAISSTIKFKCDLNYNPEIRFNRSTLRSAIPNLSEEEYLNIIIKKEKCYEDYLPETKLNTSVTNILKKYSKTNITVLVTNCRQTRAMRTLQYHNLNDKFSHFFYRQLSDNNTKINKFENALMKLGVSPNLVIVFENEIAETIDANNAGIPYSNIIKV